MELALQNIYTNRMKCHSSIQITLEEDINVPDTKPDIDRMIKQRASIQLKEAQAGQGKALLTGTLSFLLLYTTSEDLRPIHSMNGSIPFEESMNLEGLTPSDTLNCYYDLEDFQIRLINSRKISVRAIVSFHCEVNEGSQIPVGVSITDSSDSMNSLEESVPIANLYQQYQTLTYTHMIPVQNDILRIRDEVSLPKGKPNIDTILYSELTPQNLQTRLTEDGIRLTGDLKCFLLYTPVDEERRLEYLDTELSIDENIPCDQCSEQTVPDIHFLPQTQETEAKPDEDGENRLLELELTLRVESTFYEEEEIQTLADAYSTACELTLQRQNVTYEKLLCRNQGSLRVSDRLQIEKSADPILQICSVSGTVQVDHQEIQENGIYLEGAVLLDVLYITESDALPLSTLLGTIPFQHFLEVRDITEEDHYKLLSDISQNSVIMLDAHELEAKVVIDLCATVFAPITQELVSDLSISDLDLQRLQDMPGLTGYIADRDTSLWDLAKEYSTSIESIMSLNNLTSDQLHRGDRVLLMKQLPEN